MKKLGLIIFIAALSVGVVLANIFSFGKFVFKSPIDISFEKVRGSGNLVTEKREINDFSKIDAGGVFVLEISAGEEFGVEIEADDNLLPHIRTEVSNGTLEIERAKSFSSRNPVKVRISAPDIEALHLSGASRASIRNIDNDAFVIDTSGASNVTAVGRTNRLTIDMSGASRVEAESFRANYVTIDGSGASRAQVFVSEELSADLSGASHVDYSGNPTEIRKKTSGGSCLKQHKK